MIIPKKLPEVLDTLEHGFASKKLSFSLIDRVVEENKYGCFRLNKAN